MSALIFEEMGSQANAMRMASTLARAPRLIQTLMPSEKGKGEEGGSSSRRADGERRTLVRLAEADRSGREGEDAAVERLGFVLRFDAEERVVVFAEGGGDLEPVLG